MYQSRTVQGIHFHIWWERLGQLDWEPFVTRERAEARAKEVRPGESFTVDKYDQNCAPCYALYRPPV